jgi:hypothetical protein
MFGVTIFGAEGSNARLSLNNSKSVKIVTDHNVDGRERSFISLIRDVHIREKPTWIQQFITSLLLNPYVDENRMIVDTSRLEAVFYIISVFWKFSANICPPAHYAGGWPCFLIGLIMVGCLTFLLEEVSSLLSCVMGIKPGTLAITLIAVGTQLPEAIASYNAAKRSVSADAAIGNLLGINTTTILFGMGIPWVIARVYYDDKKEDLYTQPKEGILFLIAIYMIASFTGLIVILVRRVSKKCCKSFCKSELGGGSGRYLSAFLLFSLWVIFIVLGCLNHYAIETFGRFKSIFNGF